MNKRLLYQLTRWPLDYIHDSDLAIGLGVSDDARYAIVKRAMQVGLLVRIKRGLYLIGPLIREVRPDLFELAQQLCSPSAISFESALSFHGWIPEAVYTVYSATPKRGRHFETPIGDFSFLHTPSRGFYMGVERREEPIRFIATPWRALADISYVRHIGWKVLDELIDSLRLDPDLVYASDLAELNKLATLHPAPRVRKWMERIYKELVHGSVGTVWSLGGEKT